MMLFPTALFAGSRRAPAAAPDGAGLLFDFAGGAYRSGGAELAAMEDMPGYAFVRAGEQGALDGTGTAAWFAANMPAINARGFHAFDALTNLEPHSQAFALRGGYNAAIASDVAAAPDGSPTADRVTATDNAICFTFVNVANAGGPYTSSVFVPAAESSAFVYFRVEHAYANASFVAFNPATGAIGNVQNTSGSPIPMTAYAIPVGGGWRFVVVWSPPPGALTLYWGLSQTSTAIVAALGQTALFWQSQTLEGEFGDGGPLIRTAGSEANIGASALAVNLANGTYNATYTFDDDSQQQLAVTVNDGLFRHPIAGTLNRPLVKQTAVEPA